MNPEIGAVLTAAGSGSRLGHALPKALVPVAGRPLVAHAAANLRRAGVTHLVVTAAPEHLDAVRAALGDPAAVVVPGGPSRQASVAAGLAALPAAAGIVLVHDAARPFAPVALIERVVAAVLGGHVAVVPGLAVTDTMVLAPEVPGAVTGGADRAELWAVQTPQGFDRAVLERAHAAAAGRAASEATAATDDASLVAALGEPVWTVPGDPAAAKITTARDLAAAEREHAGFPVLRTGIGIDVHAFSPDGARELWVAGLHWPGEPGLAGHSDADVAAHAAADALFSAAGLGDLGSNYGTADPAWAGAAGATLLAESAARVRAAGFEIANIAVQVVGPRPRLGSRRAEAQAALSAAAGAPVTVTATTTDGLGLTGRGEGLAAIATALLTARG